MDILRQSSTPNAGQQRALIRRFITALSKITGSAVPMVTATTICPEMKEAYLSAAKEFAADSSQNDSGCIRMEVMLQEDQPDHVFIVSAWENDASMEASTTFLNYKARLKPAFLGNQTTILRSGE